MPFTGYIGGASCTREALPWTRAGWTLYNPNPVYLEIRPPEGEVWEVCCYGLVAEASAGAYVGLEVCDASGCTRILTITRDNCNSSSPTLSPKWLVVTHDKWVRLVLAQATTTANWAQAGYGGWKYAI